ncbi:hypothetical protein SteCoe_12433 [Stentor coeruleus]|uniref:Uncharacterized protein n=1 Tax=Stentor coeruleus TaxID=5963 RepID=A0A1R2CAQ0_9CILI|nr:hypothetical protein SteCoe_12433 [Stentor coeruleus]
MSKMVNENLDPFINTNNNLIQEASEVSSEITQICLDIQGTPEHNTLISIQQQFNFLIQSWITLIKSLSNQISKYQKYSQELANKNQRYRAKSDEKIIRKKTKLREKESSIQNKHRYINKSMTRIRRLWKGNIKDMKYKISIQKANRIKIKKKVDKFKEQVLKKFTIGSDLCFIERQKNIDLDAVVKERGSIEPSLLFSERSEEQIDESYAFEELMKEIDAQKGPAKRNNSNISIEKSFGGWKSEYDSENDSILPVNPDDIKKAIDVLKKANLLNPQNGGILNKLTDLLKDPENSHKLEIILQLMNFQGRLSQSSYKDPNSPPVKDEKKLSSKTLEVHDISHKFPLENEEIFELIPNPEQNEDMDKSKKFQSQKLEQVHFEESVGIPFFDIDMRFATSESGNNKPIRDSEDNHPQQELLTGLDNLSPTENKANPVKKQTTLDYQSTGISSQTGFRSRITLKTAGSDFSQKIFTPGSKSIEEAFKDM